MRFPATRTAERGRRWRWTFDAYETRIDHLIGYDSGFNLVNVDEARIRGAEFTVAAALAVFEEQAKGVFDEQA